VRDRGSAVTNYHTLVRPQLEARAAARQQQRSIAQVQQQVNTIQRDFRQVRQTGVFQTGHPTRFMTYLHYYPSLGR